MKTFQQTRELMTEEVEMAIKHLRAWKATGSNLVIAEINI